jgi:hypothetical protein
MPYELSPEEYPYYLKAIASDDHSGGSDTVSEMVLDGDLQLWLWNKVHEDEDETTILVFITQVIVSMDDSKELLVSMMGGTNVTRFASYLDIHQTIMDYGVSVGCHKMIAYLKPIIWDTFTMLHDVYDIEYVKIAMYADTMKTREDSE